MKVSLLAIPVLIVLLLLVAGLIVAASRKGFAAEVVLAISTLVSAVLAYAGLRFLFDSSDANDLRGLVISLAGVVAVITSGIVYVKVLRGRGSKQEF
jgi:hypothetical protein